MRRHGQTQGGGVEWLSPTFVDANAVRAAYTLRHGGASATDFATLNLGLHVTDDAEAVMHNRQRAAQTMQMPLNAWVVAEQVHGTNVAVVQSDDAGRGTVAHADSVPGVDALVTQSRGLTLVVLAADCVPLLFYDWRTSTIAAVHSGWQGTHRHIAVRVLETMHRQFGVQVADVQVALGPSIRKCCYEVSASLAEAMQDEFGQRVATPRFAHPGHAWLGLHDAIRQDLLKAGVRQEAIEDSGICTACHVHDYFSHRREAGRTGRHMGAICLL